MKSIVSPVRLFALFICAFASRGYGAASLDLYGTFHAMGVVVNLTGGEDPNQNATGSVSYRSGGGSYRQGFPLSRITPSRFAGSILWLDPGTSYDVRVTFVDPDGGGLNGVTVSSSASTRAEIGVPAATSSLYVSPAGSGTSCSPGSPCALAEGLSQAQAGEEVVLRGGVYYTGDLAPPRSGTPGAPIVIRGYAGETAILDGADPAVFSWTAQGGGVYSTTVNVSSPHLIVANGQRLMPYTSLSDLQNLVWGVPGLYASGTTVYVRLPGNADPNLATMAVSRFNTAFTVSQDYIYIRNLTFRHYGQGSYAKAVYFYNGSDNLVDGCTFAINDLGVGLKYASHRNVLQNSVFYDTIFGWPWDAFYAGIDLSSGGIRFYSPTDGRGNVIRRNTFHDYFDGFGSCPEATGGLTNETDVYENIVYNAGDDGMETDGESSNVRIWSNTFHDVLMGISVAPVYTGPTYAIRNLIYRTGVGNNSYTGSPFKFNSGYGQSGPIYLFHNTADAALSGNNGLYIKSPGTWSLIYSRNNIWAGTDYALENYNTSQPADLDYDGLWTSASNRLVRWNSSNYTALGAFTAATGKESHGLNVIPGFTNPGAADYTLGSGSGLIDAGAAIPGINDGYSGAAPDIGAFEQAGTSCSVTVEPLSQLFAAAGGTGSFGVSVGGGCSYSAASQDAWIIVTGGSSGGSSGTVDYSVSANPASSGRSGTILVQSSIGSTATFTVLQNGQGQLCSYSVNDFQKDFGAAGGAAQVDVTTTSGCLWGAASNAAWITFSSSSGSGSGSVMMNVGMNSGTSARSGTVTVADADSVITQEGSQGAGPVITSIKSKKARPGTSAKIIGSGFDSDKSKDTVYFGTRKAKIKRATATTLSVTIPKKLATGPVTVYAVVNKVESNRFQFTIK